MPSEEDVSALPALQGAKGPVGGTRVGVGCGVALAVALGLEFAVGVASGDGLVVSDGLGVGAASAGPANSVNAKVAAEVRPTETLSNLLTN